MRSRGEDELSRSAVTQVTEKDQVICGSVEQVGKHIARRSRTEGAKDPFVTAQSLDLHPAFTGDLVENEAQAGIIGANR